MVVPLVGRLLEAVERLDQAADVVGPCCVNVALWLLDVDLLGEPMGMEEGMECVGHRRLKGRTDPSRRCLQGSRPW
jgi:hypothetical protein